MSVHYKFKSALEYDTVTFDGLHISVKDLKNAIIQQKRIGKSTDFDLQVTNAQTKEVYEDENALIPKNTSLLIARIPTIVQKTKQWEGYGGDNTPPAKMDEGGPIGKAVDFYMKIRGANQMGPVPSNYTCYKCHQGGHWIKDCIFAQGPDPIEIKKSTGIPRSFMVPVEGPQVQGAMMTPSGSYAVPVLDHQAYTQKNTIPAPVQEPKPEIPEDLVCNICSDLLTDAVMIPCCGNSFCDECIRGVLLESEEHECPDCHEKDISPGTLIPNRFLRKSVANFKNTTGYVKKPVYREKVEPKILENADVALNKDSPLQEPESTEKVKSDAEEKTVISEADSTEQAKNDQSIDFSKDIDINEPAKSTESESIPEGPLVYLRGVLQKINRSIGSILLESQDRVSSGRHHKHKNDSPRKNTRHRRSPNYNDSGSVVFAHKSGNESKSREERSGTPTIDEPTGSGPYNPANTNYNNAAPPGTIPSMIGNIPSMQGPPQPIPTTFAPGQPPMAFPPAQGPLPNFRLPPPGTAPPPYMPPGPYPVPPRAMFDANRPPIGGPPPNYNNFPPGSRGHRDFGRRIRDRTPPGLIDDPLAAFNKMLREKDERERRAKQRNMRRSYSRSRSRSRSFSRSPIRRRSRSPRPIRRSRSRSRSFSLSRSRSRSFSGSLRGSPYRQLSPPRRSPPPSLPPRRGPARYRSPVRSPPRNRHQNDRHRDRDYDDDYGRDDRPFKDNRRNRDTRDRRSRERDRDRYFDNYDDRRAPPRPQPQQPQWSQPAIAPRPIQDNFYAPPDLQQGFQTNRYYYLLFVNVVVAVIAICAKVHVKSGKNVFPKSYFLQKKNSGNLKYARDYGPPFMNKDPPFNQPLPQTIHSIQPQRKYQDIAPPGVDDDIAPPGVEEPPFKQAPPEQKERHESPRNEDNERANIDNKRGTDKKDRDRSSDIKRRHEKRSRTPDKARNPSPRRKSKSKERDSPDKHRRRRRDSSDKEDRDRRRDHSDDERSRRGKDKKKHKDKKDSEKRKKRDKKDKHKKESKEKKPKEEFIQIIPKNIEDGPDEEKQRNERRKQEEMEEERRLEERRLEAIREEKRLVEAIKEEKRLEGIREEKRRKLAEEEKRRLIMEEEKRKRILLEESHNTPEPEEPKADLYGDMLSEEIDTTVMENYGKIDDISFEEKREEQEEQNLIEEGEIKEFEDEEKDVLELHTTDMDLKTEMDKSDILAPVPEKSKWEVEEDGQILTSPKDSHKSDSKSDKSGKVTNEVLKRAENAIFAKAINAIRPIEIKKISTDRAKLYSGEREVEKTHNQLQVTVASVDPKKDVSQTPVRLSVKERLGIKVQDTDHVINLSRHRSRTISPFSRRGESGRNYALGERRVEVDDFRSHRDRNRRSRSRRRDNSRERHRNRTDTGHHNRHEHRRGDHRREHSSRKEEKNKHDEDGKKIKRKRTRSRSESEDRKEKHKKKDKKQKKDKLKKNKDDDDQKEEEKDEEQKPQSATTKRKPTLDEANFEPDYDLESHTDEDEEKDKKKDAKKHSEKEEDKKSSSSESESDSSSEEERKKKKHKKHKKKKKRETSSSSSESESDSSDSDRDRRRKKHKKNKKKKKKSKHK
ncbi:hypothetical protein NQ314_004364 [Rhamnusium bicolor]|uniref:E3 ubiquitin-protein ligase RBBP6 n=1 Tax=Rhamnusium bicolor TaxID=1586634 RepID=A0AAV8ZJP8_9CUCU|nr:hypothetical protein NQ314_004364 [Rhamnusium bicolor]